MAEQNVEAIFQNEELVQFFKSIRSNLKSIEHGEAKYTGLLAAIVFRDVIEHFEKEEGSSGPWEEWSAGYAKKLQKEGRGGNQILQYSGKLRQSFKPEENVRISSRTIMWFNDARTKGGFPYAALHDEGGDNHPQRDFMWFSMKALDDVGNQTLAFMLEEGI